MWPRFAELMAEWQVLYAVMDADPELNAARGFCRKFEGYAATCRYRFVKEAREIVVAGKDTGAPMLTVDRTYWLDAALGRFKTAPDHPAAGYFRRVPIAREEPDADLRARERQQEGQRGGRGGDVRQYGTGPLCPRPNLRRDRLAVCAAGGLSTPGQRPQAQKQA